MHVLSYTTARSHIQTHHDTYTLTYIHTYIHSNIHTHTSTRIHIKTNTIIQTYACVHTDTLKRFTRAHRHSHTLALVHT